jgi:hypothetical protein
LVDKALGSVDQASCFKCEMKENLNIFYPLEEFNTLFEVSIKLDLAVTIRDQWIKRFWTIGCVQNHYKYDPLVICKDKKIS